MPNMTDVVSSQSSLRTPPPTQSDSSNILIDFLIYLFAAICADNVICSSIFRFIFSAILEGLALLFVAMPVMDLKKRFESDSAVMSAKIAMSAAFIAGNIAGGYAAKSLYNHTLKVEGDTIDNFEAVSEAVYGGSLVSMLYSGASALIFSCVQPQVAKCYNSCTNNRSGDGHRPLLNPF